MVSKKDKNLGEKIASLLQEQGAGTSFVLVIMERDGTDTIFHDIAEDDVVLALYSVLISLIKLKIKEALGEWI